MHASQSTLRILRGASVTAVIAAALAVVAFVAQAATGRDVLIKSASGPSVYYLASDGKRYAFADEKVFRTWFSNFKGVVTISADELSSYPLGGAVTYRPGVRLVKIATDPKTYAVDRGGKLRWVKSEDAARRLYGSDWNKKIDILSDADFAAYALGADVSNETDFNPTTVAADDDTIGEDKGLEVSAAAHRADTSPRIGDAESFRTEGDTEEAPKSPVTPPVAATPAPAQPSCTQDVWACNDWSACSASGLQSRACSKISDCAGVETPMPSASRSCQATPDAALQGPRISLIALPSAVLTQGDAVAMRFVIEPRGVDMGIKHLSFLVQSSTAGAVAISPTSASSIRRTGDGTNIPGGARINGGAACLGNSGTPCVLDVGFDGEQDIAGGTSRSFDLVLNVNGALVAGDSIQVSLRGDSADTGTGPLQQVGGAWDYRVGGGGDAFVWSDLSGSPHNDTVGGSSDWFNGFELKGLPSDPQTRSK